jgi:peptide/nickel transport system substrate-binding protein
MGTNLSRFVLEEKMLKRTLSIHYVWVFFVMASLILASCAPAATPAATSAPTQPPPVEPTKPPTAVVAAPTQPPAPTEAKPKLTPDRLVPEITIVFSSAEHDPVRNEVGLMLVKEWEKLGLRVKAQPLDYESQITILKTGEGFDAFTAGFDGRPERLDPDVLLRRIFLSTSTTAGNFMGYNNPEVDALIEAQKSEMDINKRQELVFKVQDLIANDLPAVAVWYETDVDAYNNKLWDNIQSMPGAGVYNYWTLLKATPKTDLKYMGIGTNEFAGNLNPFFETSGSDTEDMREIYDMLARVGTDGLPKPCAAESWTVVDPTTVEVTIRQGMKWSDGVPVTANDVKYSYDIQKTEGASLYKIFLQNITSIDVTDDYHLTLHLEKPDAPMFMATFAQVYIIPEHIWSKVSGPKADYNNNNNPIASGPFKLVYLRPGEEIKFETNKDYQFPPKMDGFIEAAYANMDAIFQALVNQEIHMNYDPLNPVQAQQAKAAPYLTVVEAPGHSVRIVGFNVRKPPFSYPEFRDAIGYTINFDNIVNVILGGYGTKGGSGIIAPANSFWFSPNQKIRQYDPAKARELLAAAGYEWDDQGLLYYPASK